MTRTHRLLHGRRARAAVCVLTVAALVTACAPSLPEPEPDPVPAVPGPALTIDQSTDVLTQVSDVLAKADAALSAADLAPRVEGPALAIRTAEYSVAAATAGAKAPTVLPEKAQSLVVPNTDAWLRTTYAVTEQPDDLQAQRLLVLQQNAPRGQYKLWGWARLLPGVSMPAMAPPGTGSLPVAPDSTELVATPTDVVAQYADVLTNGDKSEFAAAFEPDDAFRTGIEAGRTVSQQKVQQVGTVAETYTPNPDQVFAVATADGGALVVGGLTTVTTFGIAQGSLTVGPQDAALSGKTSVTKNLVVTWADVLAFYVPPAGSSALIQVLAGEHARTAVTGA